MKNRIVGVIENISAGTEETSASSEEISASTQEQLDTMAKIGIAAKANKLWPFI